MPSTLRCKRAKPLAKRLLAIVSVLCSLWLVWGQCLKFFSGATTIMMEQEQKNYLPLPQFLMCNKKRYNKKELRAMEIPVDFFDDRNQDTTLFSQNKSFPDLNSTWQRATWPVTDFEADWWGYEGMVYTDTNSFLNIFSFSNIVNS